MILAFFYYFYPVIYASVTNRKLKKDNKKSYETSKTKWKNLINIKQQTPEQIEKIANDLYVSYENGISKIENKAAALLSGVGFPIALLAIILGSSSVQGFWLFKYLVIIFGFAILEMAVSAVSSGFAFKVGTRYVSNRFDLEKYLKETKDVTEWATIQLANIEMNEILWDIKAHWLDSAQKHFIRGIVLTSIGLIVLLIILVLNPGQNFQVDLIDNIFINDILSIDD